MARPFEFNEASLFQARLRQHGECACCGEDLADLEEHDHHVIPNQAGSPGSLQHAWLATVINCVVLCVPCHERVHENARYRNGGVAPPSYFIHSHGDNENLHRLWVMEVERLSRTVWR